MPIPKPWRKPEDFRIEITSDSTNIYTMKWLGVSGSATFYQDSYTRVFCKYCEVKNHKDNSFCVGCGAPL